MGQRQGAVPIVDQGRLGVAELGFARGRVAGVTDGRRTFKLSDMVGLDGLGDQTHPLANTSFAVLIHRHDPRGLLAPVLERIQPQKGELRRCLMTGNGEHTAFLS